MGNRKRSDPKPWKPYPVGLAALHAVADGSPLTRAAEKLGVTAQVVSTRLSVTYDRLGIKDDARHNHHSHDRRYTAIKICLANGWLDDDPVCVCTHRLSEHNINHLCIAVPGTAGCGCMGFLAEGAR